MSRVGGKECKKCGNYLKDDHQYFETLPSGNRRGTCRKCQYARAKEKGYATYGVKTSRQQRKHEMKYRYGLSMEDFEQMHTQQHGECKICGEHESECGTLHVDHCHTTKAVRGLLCRRCNMGLGYFKDSSNRLQSAMYYLREENQ